MLKTFFSEKLAPLKYSPYSTATLSLLKSVIVGATTYQHRMHYNAQVWCSNLPATNAQRHYYMEALKPAAKEGIDTLVGVID
jgi:hypothetical protein